MSHLNWLWLPKASSRSVMIWTTSSGKRAGNNEEALMKTGRLQKNTKGNNNNNNKKKAFYVGKPESILAQARCRRNNEIRYESVKKKGMQKRAYRSCGIVCLVHINEHLIVFWLILRSVSISSRWSSTNSGQFPMRLSHSGSGAYGRSPPPVLLQCQVSRKEL